MLKYLFCGLERKNVLYLCYIYEKNALLSISYVIIFSVVPPIKDTVNRYTRNSAEHWNVDYGYSKYAGIETYPRRALLSGSANALKVNMNVDMDDLDYACTSFQGFQVFPF